MLTSIVGSRDDQAQDVRIVDMSTVLTETTDYRNIPNVDSGLHPNVVGEDKMAAAWYGPLKEAVDDILGTVVVVDPPRDTIPPNVLTSSPFGTLPSETRTVTITVTTDTPASCKWGTDPAVTFPGGKVSAMQASVGGTVHSASITLPLNVQNQGSLVARYVLCTDTHQNVMQTSYPIIFSIDAPVITTTGDSTPPTFVSNPAVGQITTHSAVISYGANEEVSAYIEYSIDTIEYLRTHNNDYSTSNTHYIDGLAPATTYYYRVVARDRAGAAVAAATG